MSWVYFESMGRLLKQKGNSKMNETAVILLSGGLDSSVLLHYIIKKLNYKTIFALSFNYGQKHNKELEMAESQISGLPEIKERKIIDISFFSDLIDGSCSLTTGGAEIPKLSDLSETQKNQPSTYVPNRNMILLSLAAAYAEAKMCPTVFYGAQAQDEYGYWDCTTEFLEQINAVFSLNRKQKIKIEAPFVKLKKFEEVKIGAELGVNFFNTWSCYRGEEKHCGLCPTCVERKNAFVQACIKDPTIYAV